MNVFLWTAVGFLSGSVPYSLILGYLVKKTDIRNVGDGNPGATNLALTAGSVWFVAGALLDGFKGMIPVVIAWETGRITGWECVPVAAAPVLGHAFSPWLKFRGGKAVAVTFGIWAGLTAGLAPFVLGIMIGLMHLIISVSGWVVMATMLLFGGFIWSMYSSPEFMVLWAVNLLILIWKHRTDLRTKPGLHPRALRLVRKSP